VTAATVAEPTPDSDHIDHSVHTLHTTDGVELAARFRPTTSPEAARAAVVLVHGFAASQDEANVLAVADALVTAGYDVVSYDARGHGASGGTCTLGDHEEHDVAAAVEIARRNHDRVVLLGASMGGIAVLRHAANVGQVDGVVAVSSPSAWRMPRSVTALLAAGLTRTGLGRRLAARHLRVRVHPRWTNPEPPAELAARIGVPLAIVHGQRDRFIAVTNAAELYRAAGGPRRLFLVEGMGHAYDAAGLPAIRDAVDWVLTAT
jgi:alpha-beta hydrolase superfamily lysophospholipase